MKKITYILSTILALLALESTNAQVTINGISTNPQNPINNTFLPWANAQFSGTFTHNPFLNTFNWYPDQNNNIEIPYTTGFNIAGISLTGNNINSKNPFYDGLDIGLSDFAKALYYDNMGNSINSTDRDFRWQDGWELLWMNLGKTPDGEPINAPKSGGPLMSIDQAAPNNIPYFVLYNRYRGTVRLFANVWFNNTVGSRFQKVIPTIMFENDKIVNGLFRHTNSYDLALDNLTEITDKSAPSSQPTDQNLWLMSDYQMAFDPCICNRNQAKLKFNFKNITSMDIKMISRSITIQQNITDNSYQKDDFLNLTDVSAPGYRSGNRIYNRMDNMLDNYLKSVDKYKIDLANYNS
ncbi:MAG: hypothetical protein WCI53_02020 [Bacteroidota bacterium]|jgi:hypothetical protein